MNSEDLKFERDFEDLKRRAERVRYKPAKGSMDRRHHLAEARRTLDIIQSLQKRDRLSNKAARLMKATAERHLAAVKGGQVTASIEYSQAHGRAVTSRK